MELKQFTYDIIFISEITSEIFPWESRAVITYMCKVWHYKAQPLIQGIYEIKHPGHDVVQSVTTDYGVCWGV